MDHVNPEYIYMSSLLKRAISEKKNIYFIAKAQETTEVLAYSKY